MPLGMLSEYRTEQLVHCEAQLRRNKEESRAIASSGKFVGVIGYLACEGG